MYLRSQTKQKGERECSERGESWMENHNPEKNSAQRTSFQGSRECAGGLWEGLLVELEQGSLAAGNGTNLTKCKIYCVLLGSCDK